MPQLRLVYVNAVELLPPKALDSGFRLLVVEANFDVSMYVIKIYSPVLFPCLIARSKS